MYFLSARVDRGVRVDTPQIKSHRRIRSSAKKPNETACRRWRRAQPCRATSRSSRACSQTRGAAATVLTLGTALVSHDLHGVRRGRARRGRLHHVPQPTMPALGLLRVLGSGMLLNLWRDGRAKSVPPFFQMMQHPIFSSRLRSRRGGWRADAADTLPPKIAT